MIVSKCHDDEFKTLDDFLAGIDRAHESVEASDVAAYAFSVLGRNLTSADYEPAVSLILQECRKPPPNLMLVERKLLSKRT